MTDSASKVIQDLLGLSAIIQSEEFSNSITSAFCNAIKTAAADDELSASTVKIMKLAVEDKNFASGLSGILGDAVFLAINKSISDKGFEATANKIISLIVTNESIKGPIAEGIFKGAKRLSTDGEFLGGVSTIISSVVQSQATTNVLNRSIDQLVNRLKELILSKELYDRMIQAAEVPMESLKETMNVSISENFENLKDLEFTISGSIGGPNVKSRE